MENLAARLPDDLVWYAGLRLQEHVARHEDPKTVTLSDALIMWLNDRLRGHTNSRI